MINLEKNQVVEATNAFFQLHNAADAKRKENVKLFGDDQPLYLQIAVVKIPHTTEKTYRFEMAHPVWKEVTNVCLFVKDFEKGYRVDADPTVQHYRDLMKSNGIKVDKIVTLHQLKSDYKQFDQKRKLSNSCEFFLADARVYETLPTFLGKAFYGRKKLPIKIDLTKGNLKKEFNKATRMSYLPQSHGCSMSLRIGHTHMPREEVVENIQKVLEQINMKLPGGFGNIKSIHLAEGNVSLPLFLTTVTIDKNPKKAKKSKQEETSDSKEEETSDAKEEETSDSKEEETSDSKQENTEPKTKTPKRRKLK